MTVTNTVAEAPGRVREFQFSDADFCALRDLVKQLTGINLADSKRELVYGRVSRRLRTLGLKRFSEYRQLLEGDDESELVEFCNAMTTNLTAFFRESHHFDYLRDQFLLPRVHDARAPRRIRIWSAACSSGEEPYSLAMTVCEAIPDWKRWDIKILATDIDSEILARARRGIYTADRVKGLDPGRLERFFRAPAGADQSAYQVDPDLAGLITFKQINLMHDLPMKGPLDVVVCRNVIIYFDKDAQRGLFTRIAKLQRPNDLLFLGHSESLFKVSNDYDLIGKTIYRRN
ncbi:MAG: protein-glutamate O-methyltransferase CheR [Gammaproteobacteria bacterium]|nr:protein-glutamate O-methyltransferase CheR [Gammaproteobacteria bacterium]